MENLLAYLYSTIHTLLECVAKEEYEVAAALRDEIEFYISNACSYLSNNKLTKSTYEDIYENLIDLKSQIIKEVSDMLEVPIEKRIMI